ncbi:MULTISPECIES: cysteine--tRNA ligase [Pseudomonas]|uniref:cysteine--tRNA ligase n=1 Tax=Pseudomonas TaxID=286 RepID=UPI001623A89D|nr:MULTISPECIES: cysteine--tRNA ligase [Pseudomonas]MDH1692418.1 cysteine--tRNA ligase [Pseudomonas sp. GD03766]QNG09467.1 cysteine--tRNA ligase [Pseudomonas putida]UFH29498.1 cysteine--tRNA ligase [Pseudomonas sp. CIP-10]HDS1060570.1 cysteine--tRNA ligase [Pseudomonas putida]
MTEPIYLHNTLTRRKEVLRTSRPDQVTMYVCGSTVYNYAHIGNARPAVVFDLLARLLRHDYAELVYARNFTDVDDKINAAAAATDVPIASITDRFIDAYHSDMTALGVASPDLEPRVTAHIPQIIALIEALIERGHAYVEQGHVLFHVPSYPAYGELSGRNTKDMLAGARVEVAPYKRNPLDFVLWKPSTADQPGWSSPWGRGRPGWHVECSAMIGQHLGHTIDIHGGGQDLIFPHHENEIAQGTCAHGTLYCRTWVHNSFVTVDGQKMSKSLGNVRLVRDLLGQAPGEAIRLALLSTHYRRPMDWNAKRLSAAVQTLIRFYASLARCDDVPGADDVAADGQLLDALRDDLGVAEALARLHVLRQALENASDETSLAQTKARLVKSAALLGLLQQTPLAALRALQPHTEEPPRQAALLRLLEARDFATADRLRSELEEAGYTAEDTAQGPRLRPLRQATSCRDNSGHPC